MSDLHNNIDKSKDDTDITEQSIHLREIPQHNLPEHIFDNARNEADTRILDAADDFLKNFNIDNRNTIGINAIKDVLSTDSLTTTTIGDNDYEAAQSLQLFQVIHNLTKAQEAVRAAEQERINAYQEYNTTNKKLIEIENTKLHHLDDIMSLLKTIVRNKTIESSLTMIIENQKFIYTQVYRVLTLVDTIIRILQINNSSEKSSKLIEESCSVIREGLKDYGIPHVNINVPVNNIPSQQNINGNVHTERDFNIR